MWWSALVEDVTCTGSGANLRISAVLLFEAKENYNEVRATADFLDGEILKEHKPHEDDEAPESTTWKRDLEHDNDDEHDLDYDGGATGSRSTRRSTRNAKSRRTRPRRTRRSRFRTSSGTGRQQTPRENVTSRRDSVTDSLQSQLNETKTHVEQLHRELGAMRSHFISQHTLFSQTFMKRELKK